MPPWLTEPGHRAVGIELTAADVILVTSPSELCEHPP